MLNSVKLRKMGSK